MSFKKKKPHFHFIIFQLVVFFIVFLVAFRRDVLANTYLFGDDFEHLDLIKWIKNGEFVEVSNGWAKFWSESGEFPFLTTNLSIPSDLNDFEIEVSFKYDHNDHWGAGITFGNLIPPYNATEDYMRENNGRLVHFQIWQDSSSGKGLRLKYHHSEEQNWEDAEFFTIKYGGANSHVLKVKKSGSKYSFFIDENFLFERDGSSRVPSTITIGNPIKMAGSPRWVEFSVDYIRVTTGEELSTTPLIILPGLGASWNTRAMVYGEDVGLDQWQMTPFVNIYERLVETAKEGGYVEGEDLFVWNYDWRKPLSEIALDLGQFIDSVPELKSAEKLDFVGHSLGGLAARTWTQDYEEDDKVNSLITVGSPHYGAVQAYNAIAGGMVGDKIDLTWLAMQLLLQIQRNSFETNAALIREITPVLKDIIPVFDFIEKNEIVISALDISFPNNFLFQLNQEAEILSFSHFLTGGIENSTPEWVFLKKETFLDQLLGLWPDGRLMEIAKGTGDGTVLKKSAHLEGGYDSELEFGLNHRDLINDPSSVEKIMSLLGKEGVQISGPDAYPEDNLLIFYLASPAALKVNGLIPGISDLQFIVIPNPLNDLYQAEVTGTGNGDYHLYLGQITPLGNFWSTYEGEIEAGEVENYQFEIDFNDPRPEPLVNSEDRYHLIRAKNLVLKLHGQTGSEHLFLSAGYLEQAINSLLEENWPETMEKTKEALYQLSLFRKNASENQLEEFNKAEEIMEIILRAWENILNQENLFSQKQANQNYRRARSYSQISSRLIKKASKKNQETPLPKIISAQKSEEILDQLKEEWRLKNFSLVEARGYFAYLLAFESFLEP